MSLITLTSLRNLMMSDAAISAWFTQRYAKQPNHFIGYKQPVVATDYPSICYVPVRDKRGEQPYDEHIVSVVLHLNEPGVTADVFDGVAMSDALTNLIINALLAISSPISIKHGVITVTGDLGLQHPFYSTELQMTVLSDAVAEAAAIESSLLGDFDTLHADYDLQPFAGSAEHDKWLEEPANFSTSTPDLSDIEILPQS